MNPRAVRIAHIRRLDRIEIALGALLMAAAPVCAVIFVLQSV